MKTCYFCKGKIVNKRIRHVHHWGEEIIIFENVPADVCTQCGEVFFSPEVLETMDKVSQKRIAPKKSIAVPVFSLP
ncbi:MAG: type II toxin-antitoxin system MqsA family antitoxin [Chloroflexi bacterium]|nr:type II toxin-antitoxin system MqsA family antitoxin [Chloroflexota bacterium]